jgi:hypothetical protein
MCNTGLTSRYDAQIIGHYLKERLHIVDTIITVHWGTLYLGLHTA